MTAILALLSSAGVLKWIGIVSAGAVALVAAWFHGKSSGSAQATQAAASTVAQAQAAASVAGAAQAQQAAEAKADAAQAQAAAAQASLDAKQTASDIGTKVDQMSSEDVANELKKDWTR